MERRTRYRYCADGVGIKSKLCIRFSAENDPESEEDNEGMREFFLKKNKDRKENLLEGFRLFVNFRYFVRSFGHFSLFRAHSRWYAFSQSKISR